MDNLNFFDFTERKKLKKIDFVNYIICYLQFKLYIDNYSKKYEEDYNLKHICTYIKTILDIKFIPEDFNEIGNNLFIYFKHEIVLNFKKDDDFLYNKINTTMVYLQDMLL